jgi:taurine dioxygenase
MSATVLNFAARKPAAAKPVARTLATRKLHPFGVEILDLDIPNAAEPDLLGFAEICRANAVVVVRGQKLSGPQLLALSARLGKVSPQRRTGPHPEFPGISVLSNKKVDGRLIGAHEAGRKWHTDGTTYPTLGLTTMLYGIECPPEGADTLIADAVAAFASLPEGRQKELEKLQLVHNRAHLIAKFNAASLTPEDRAKMQDIVHPAVIASPIDGCKSFFVTTGSTKGVVGMTEEAGMALIDELIAYASQDQFVYRHKWRDGDILIWNDMITLHRATPYDDKKYERLMWRTWIRPFSAGAGAARD